MVMRSALTAVFIFLAFPTVYADVSEWEKVAYKVDQPNELAYFAFAQNSCPVMTEEVGAIVEGVLIRSRIKPVGGFEWFNRDLCLYVNIGCVTLKNNNPAYNISIQFATWNSMPPVKYPHEFGFFGIGDGDHLKQSVKEAVEDAVTAYMEVNFDLGSD